MAQFQAGYYIEGLQSLYNEHPDREKIFAILNSLSYFDIQSESWNNSFRYGAIDESLHSLLLVASNFITRGLPTLASLYIEDIFAKTFGKTEAKQEKQGETVSISYPFLGKKSEMQALREKISQAFHIIDPRINHRSQFEPLSPSWEKLKGGYDEDFLFAHIPAFAGEEFMQIIEPQRDYISILHRAMKADESFKKYVEDTSSTFTKLPVDFAIELPYPVNDTYGKVIEIDGREHDSITQRRLDNLRDFTIQKAKWAETLRIRTDSMHNIREHLSPLKDFLSNEYFKTIRQNYHRPLYDTDAGLEALQIALTPIAVARLQKTIIECCLAGIINIEQEEKIKIAIVERDVPCGFLATHDLQQLLSALFSLAGRHKAPADFEVEVFNTKEFSKCSLHQVFTQKAKPVETFDSQKEFDLLLDISVLQRPTIKNPALQTKAKHTFTIRSSHSVVSDKKTGTGELIRYQADNNEDFTTHLKFFLQNAFRKENFLAGQYEILKRSLQQRDVIGLLPAKGGKTIAYQLSALLQAGICLTVCPVNALIIQQIETLKKYGIDSGICHQYPVVYDKPLHADFCENQFMFVLPESFHTENFRESLQQMRQEKLYFSYCVIDEAHCISELGHDFRFAYHGIGKSLKELCRNADDNPATVIALSGTASFDVLSDIQQELQTNTGAIVKIDVVRPEILIKIETSQINELEKQQDINKIKSVVAAKKQADISRQITDWLADDSSILLYCPQSKGIFGVTDQYKSGLADKIAANFPDIEIDYFLGTKIIGYQSVNNIAAYHSAQSLKKFMENKLQILVTTDEFRIGLDKNNISGVVHLNMPASPEAFVQEIGRAGNKSRKPVSRLFFNNQKIRIKETNETLDENNQWQTSVDEINISIDKFILHTSIRKQFRGKRKELAVINELLTEIKYPIERNILKIYREIENRFGIHVTFSFFPENHPYQLLVRSSNQNYGYIDFRGFTSIVNQTTDDIELSNDLLNFIKETVDRLCPENQNIFKWLDSGKVKEPQKGILFLYEEMNEGQATELTLHFENDRITRIFSVLNRRFPGKFTEKGIKNIAERCFTSVSFVEALKSVVGGQSIPANQIEPLFYEIRTEDDTFRAIYRLAILGYIEQTDVDFEKQLVKLSIKKKSENYHLVCLFRYIEKFISKSEVLTLFDDIASYKGNNVKEKCLNYLLDFVYNTIAQKRYQALDDMEKICLTGLENKNGDEANTKIHELIHQYFSQSTKEKEISPNFVYEAGKTDERDFEIVKSYIAEVGDDEQKMTKLSATTRQLLDFDTENYVFLLLNAYTKLSAKEQKDENFEQDFEQLVNGMVKLQKQFTGSYEKFSEYTGELLENIYIRKPSLRDKMEPLVYLKLHTTWLRNFNAKFLYQWKTK